MARILVHCATGPENPTRAALACSSHAPRPKKDTTCRSSSPATLSSSPARRPPTPPRVWARDLVSEHLDALAAAGVPLFLSGMSSKARAIDASVREGVELVTPQRLVELATSAETVLTY